MNTGTRIQDLKRVWAASIWTFVESDLTSAIPDLPLGYDTATNLGRATKGAATALLGKVYLYEKKWGPAQTTLALLDQTPFTYKLDPSYDNLFSTTNQKSPESIFQVMNSPWTDWGIGNQVMTISKGHTRFAETWPQFTAGEQAQKCIAGIPADKDVYIYVFRPGFENFKGNRENLVNALEKNHFTHEVAMTYPDQNGSAMIDIWKIHR